MNKTFIRTLLGIIAVCGVLMTSCTANAPEVDTEYEQLKQEVMDYVNSCL